MDDFDDASSSPENSTGDLAGFSPSSSAPDAPFRGSDVRRVYNPGPDDCEDVESYRPGGLNPIDIGDRVVERYDIVLKLGYGATCTVWLARDIKEQRYVALKVVAADISAIYSSESEIYTILKWILPAELSTTHLVPLYDTFYIDGPNGKNFCMSLGLCGPSLYEMHGHLKLRCDLYSEIALQIVTGLAEMHKTGLVYSDLNGGCVAFSICNIDHLTPERLQEIFGGLTSWSIHPIEAEDVEWASIHAPRRQYEKLGYRTEAQLELLRPVIKFLDFGASYFKGQKQDGYSHGCTERYADPDILWWDSTASQASDSWALGCVLFQLRSGLDFLEQFMFPDCQSEVIDRIGPLPDAWAMREQSQQEQLAADELPGSPVSARLESHPGDLEAIRVRRPDEATMTAAPFATQPEMPPSTHEWAQQYQHDYETDQDMLDASAVLGDSDDEADIGQAQLPTHRRQRTAWRRLLLALTTYVQERFNSLRSKWDETTAKRYCSLFYNELRAWIVYIFRASSSSSAERSESLQPQHSQPMSPGPTEGNGLQLAEGGPNQDVVMIGDLTFDQLMEALGKEDMRIGNAQAAATFNPYGQDRTLRGVVRNIGALHPWHQLTLEERRERLDRFFEERGDYYIANDPREKERDILDRGPPGPPPLSAEEADDFEDLLRQLFTWERADRALPADVLQHAWLHGNYFPPEAGSCLQEYYRGVHYFRGDRIYI